MAVGTESLWHTRMAAAVRYNRVNLKPTVNFLYRDHLHGQLEASSLPVSSSSRRLTGIEVLGDGPGCKSTGLCPGPRSKGVGVFIHR